MGHRGVARQRQEAGGDGRRGGSSHGRDGCIPPGSRSGLPNGGGACGDSSQRKHGRRDGLAGKEMAGTAATRPRERGCGSAPKRRVRSGGQHQRVWSSAGGRMSGMAQPVCSQRWQRRAADAVRCGGGVTGSWLWRRGCGCCGYGGCGDGGCGDGGRGCGGRRYGGLGRLAGAYVTP